MQADYPECWFSNCHITRGIEFHHIFYGTANRKKSEKYGLVVPLCLKHHNIPPLGVHFNRENNLVLKRWGQRKFEETHTRQEFMDIFGKNYI